MTMPEEQKMHRRRLSFQSGVSVIEVMIATLVLMICSLGIVGLISASIVTNNRNKLDSTGTMLTQAVVERVKSTIIGTGTSSLVDCSGSVWTIETAPGGAALSGARIDFSESSPPADYFMSYIVRSPCNSTGSEITTYDVRWHVEVVGAAAGTPTNTYMVTVGARMQGHSNGNMFYSLPANYRVMAGN
jgi:Flp pilus assembly protein TadG